MGELHYEYEDAWVRAGYNKNMGSGKVMLPPPKEFVRVYRFLAADHAISSIAFGRLKVSKISEVNDPYEFLPYHRIGEMGAILTRIREHADKTQRLLCFSANWTSPVLWGHYGDRHRGVCLGFDLLKTSARHVRYQEDRTPFPIPSDPVSESPILQLTEDLIGMKCDHWKYEEEIRALVKVDHVAREGSFDFLHLDPALRLAEVILGFQCSIALEQMRSFVLEKYQGIPVFRTRLADKYFRIVPDEKTLP